MIVFTIESVTIHCSEYMVGTVSTSTTPNIVSNNKSEIDTLVPIIETVNNNNQGQ